MKKLLLVCFMASFWCSLLAQQYVSLDKFTKINAIQIIAPSGESWRYDNPSDYSILLIDENVNFEEVGGSKDNLAKYAILFKKEQLSELAKKVKASGTYFLPKLPVYQLFYLPALQKEAGIMEEINGALIAHRFTLNDHPETSVYGYCQSLLCPASVSHRCLGSFQITKSGDKYYLLAGEPMNSGGTPIPWKVSDVKKYGTAEIAIELTPAQYNNLF